MYPSIYPSIVSPPTRTPLAAVLPRAVLAARQLEVLPVPQHVGGVLVSFVFVVLYLFGTVGVVLLGETVRVRTTKH